MRYAKKRDSDVDWQDELRAQEAKRERRREAPVGAKLTRKMAKLDARLLAMAGREEVDPMVTVKPPAAAAAAQAVEEPLPKRAVQPPPLPIPFPFPFANPAASGQMPLLVGVLSARDESFMSVRDSWLMPPPAEASIRVNMRSLVPREPDPFTIIPPNFSLPPR